MADLVFVLAVLGFFALAGLFVRFCDRIIGQVETPTGQPEQARTPLRQEAAR